MAEVAFARNFLASLDSKPTKFSADHVEDPRNYPSRGAVRYIHLPYFLFLCSEPIYWAA